MSVYESLGLQPIVNASGAVTRLGGARMSRAVVGAFSDAARQSVPVEQVQAAASRAIAQVTGAEAGLVTTGSAAALTLGAAAILAGYDLGRMEMLPHCDGFPCEFVVAREHRNGYDHAVRAAGARLVDVGFNEVTAGAGVRRTEAWEYVAAFSKNTAGVLYVYSADSQPPLEEVVRSARQHNIPVLVDAAGELPPRANLLLPRITGADLVAFSGGKAIRGPQSSGILCGRQDLIASAALQMLDMDDYFELWDPPTELIDKKKLNGIPRHGIGRGMKVAIEEIVALMTALAIFAEGDFSDQLDEQRGFLQAIEEGLDGASARCQRIEHDDGETPPTLVISIPDSSSDSALEVCRRLRQGSPPVYVGHGRLHQGALVINPTCLTAEDANVLVQRLREELAN